MNSAYEDGNYIYVYENSVYEGRNGNWTSNNASPHIISRYNTKWWTLSRLSVHLYDMVQYAK